MSLCVYFSCEKVFCFYFLLFPFVFVLFLFKVFEARRKSVMNSQEVDGEIYCIHCGNRVGDVLGRVERRKIVHLDNIRLIQYNRYGRGMLAQRLVPTEVSIWPKVSPNITIIITPIIDDNSPSTSGLKSECNRELENKIDKIIEREMDSFIEVVSSVKDGNLVVLSDEQNSEQNVVEDHSVIRNDVALAAEQPISVDMSEPLVSIIAPNVQVVYPIVREPDTEPDEIDWNLLNEMLVRKWRLISMNLMLF